MLLCTRHISVDCQASQQGEAKAKGSPGSSNSQRRVEPQIARAGRPASQAQIAAHGIVGGSPEESVLDSWDRAFGAAATAYETRLSETQALQRQARAALKAGKNALRGSILGSLGIAARGRANYLQATNQTGKWPYKPSLLFPTDPRIGHPAATGPGKKRKQF